MTNNIFDDVFLNKCREVTEMYDKFCGSWSNDSQLLHIITEVTEVKDVLRNKKEKYGRVGTIDYQDKLLEEIADIFLTTISLVNLLKIDNESLNHAIKNKLLVVENRLKLVLKERMGVNE